MKDFLWFFITILPIILGIPHMAQPTVMTIINVFITGIASVFISLEPDKTRVKGNFYRNVVEKAIVSALYMFIPVVLVTFYVLISQLITKQAYNVQVMETVIENKTIVQFGWLPIIALSISFYGFVVFFNSCRPFTKFRKILFVATVFVVLLVLYLAPEYFIVSGTSMVDPEIMYHTKDIMYYVFTHLEANATFALYRTMNLEQVIVLASCVVLSIPFYIITTRYTSKLVERLLFSTREFKDE